MPNNKYPIALCCSDTHWANWKQFNKDGYRLKAQSKLWKQIYKVSAQLGVDILFCGDLIDHPKHMDNVVHDAITKSFKDMPQGASMVGIDGNHDFPFVNTFANPVRGYFGSFTRVIKQIECVNFTYKDIKGAYYAKKPYNIRVHGIPYINGDVDFVDALKARIKEIDKKKTNILLIHRDLAGAEEPDGKVTKKDPEQDGILKKLFKKFDLVLSGHIHKPQRIKKLGKHVYMLGATHQQRRSDAGCSMGYWILYNDLSMEFKPLKSPEFKFYKEGQEPEDDYHFWTKTIEKKEVKESSSSEFNIKRDRKSLVKAYMIARGIKSKSKLKKAMKYL